MARANANFGGVYANMDFEPYQYREFPKHIPTGTHGEYAVALNPREEANIRARVQEEADAEAAQEQGHTAMDPQKEILFGRAKELGIPFNRKWSISKLQELIITAEAAIDELPAEENLPVVQVVKEPANKLINFATTIDPGVKTTVSTPEESEEDKDLLIEEARDLGLPATRVWGVAKLKAEIAKAKKS